MKTYQAFSRISKKDQYVNTEIKAENITEARRWFDTNTYSYESVFEKGAENPKTRFYKREIEGMNSVQKLIIIGGEFNSIYNESHGAHITYGFCPNEFEILAKVPRGFYTKYGFKQYQPNEIEMDFISYQPGDFTELL